MEEKINQVYNKICPNCGKHISSVKKIMFCSECGHQFNEQPKIMFCTKCGGKLDENGNCVNCDDTSINSLVEIGKNKKELNLFCELSLLLLIGGFVLYSLQNISYYIFSISLTYNEFVSVFTKLSSLCLFIGAFILQFFGKKDKQSKIISWIVFGISLYFILGVAQIIINYV